MPLVGQALTATFVIYELYSSYNHQTCIVASHRNYKTEQFYTKLTNLMCHLRLSAEQQKVKLTEVKSNEYEIEMIEDNYGMKGWKLYTFPQDGSVRPVVAHKYKKSYYSLEKIDDEHYYIKDIESGLYLTPDPANFRDRESVFVMAKKFDDIKAAGEGIFYLKKIS